MSDLVDDIIDLNAVEEFGDILAAIEGCGCTARCEPGLARFGSILDSKVPDDEKDAKSWGDDEDDDYIEHKPIHDRLIYDKSFAASE